MEPLDHKLFEAYDEVSVTLPPEQKEVGPFALIIGAAGIGFTVTTVGDEEGDTQPFPSVTVTEYEPAEETDIDCVNSPVDHIFPPVEEDVNVTEEPAQIDSVVPVTIVGAGGNEFTVTVLGAEVPELHPFEITCTKNVPEVFTTID